MNDDVGDGLRFYLFFILAKRKANVFDSELGQKGDTWTELTQFDGQSREAAQPCKSSVSRSTMICPSPTIVNRHSVSLVFKLSRREGACRSKTPTKSSKLVSSYVLFIFKSRVTPAIIRNENWKPQTFLQNSLHQHTW